MFQSALTANEEGQTKVTDFLGENSKKNPLCFKTGLLGSRMVRMILHPDKFSICSADP